MTTCRCKFPHSCGGERGPEQVGDRLQVRSQNLEGRQGQAPSVLPEGPGAPAGLPVASRSLRLKSPRGPLASGLAWAHGRDGTRTAVPTVDLPLAPLGHTLRRKPRGPPGVQGVPSACCPGHCSEQILEGICHQASGSSVTGGVHLEWGDDSYPSGQ
uniref:Uncharacterized protein n=1 Tax=Molossus molossus TaxID=27622 RepID=A0A7J8JXM0_MOLMO|nr:hypothetical protein HJG59_008108 [Molossus molossus]